jgi:hypothetical protein
VKKFVAILFSLLLIVAQTFAVARPVSSSAPVTKPSCCGDDCSCCVSQSRPSPAPSATMPAPAPAHNLFSLPPATIALFKVGPLGVESSPASASAQFRPAAVLIFQRNCLFLI